ncbi:AbgT family transporter [Mycobacterium sp. NPDC003449]
MTTDTRRADAGTPPSMGRLFRALGTIERAGNRLPHPFWLFVILTMLLAVASSILAAVGASAVLPNTGETVEVQNLLSVAGATHAVESALTNYSEFPPLSVILVIVLGVSVAERSGLITALLRITVGRLPGRYLTFAVAFAAMISHVMGDAAYLVMIPLGALAFRSAGRSPVLGVMVAYVATSVGFNASPLVTPSDALRSALSDVAAKTVDPGYTITPLATYFFSAASSLVLATAIALVVDRVLAKRPELSGPGDDDQIADTLFSSARHLPDNDDPEADDVRLSPVERRGMRNAGIVAALYALGVVGLLLPGSPFLGEGGGIVESLVIGNVSLFLSLFFAAVGFAYGRATGTVPTLADVPGVMAEGLKTMTPVLVLYFTVSQFLAYFKWTGIGSLITVNLADILRSAQAPHLVILLGIVLAVSFLNMIVTSGTAMWSLLAPIVVPLAMYLGLAPETATVAFMIGDSVTNCVTPMHAYFVLALGFVQQLRRGAGIGTMLSFTVPVSLTVFVAWTGFFVLWYAMGISLGPGVAVR